MFKEITKMIIALAIVAGAVVSLFVTVNAVGEELIRWACGIVIGFYFAQTSLGTRLTSKK